MVTPLGENGFVFEKAWLMTEPTTEGLAKASTFLIGNKIDCPLDIETMAWWVEILANLPIGQTEYLGRFEVQRTENGWVAKSSKIEYVSRQITLRRHDANGEASAAYAALFRGVNETDKTDRSALIPKIRELVNQIRSEAITYDQAIVEVEGLAPINWIHEAFKVSFALED